MAPIYHVISSSCTDGTTIYTQVWKNWVFSSYEIVVSGSATFENCTFDGAWVHWVGNQYDATATSTCTDDSAWTVWVADEFSNSEDNQANREWMRQDYEAAQVQEQEHAEAARRKREEAESVAIELLMELIGPVEAEVYKKTGRLIVKGRHHDYMIHKNRAVAGANVTRIEKDKLVDLCVHLPEYHEWCETDNVIALKMAIEADEKNFKGNVIKSVPRLAELPLAANG